MIVRWQTVLCTARQAGLITIALAMRGIDLPSRPRLLSFELGFGLSKADAHF